MLRRKLSRSQVRAMETSMHIPHKGSLFMVDDSMGVPSYVLEIAVDDSENTHELVFCRHDFQVASRLFAIMDMDSTGIVHRKIVQDFVLKRCPVFIKRDEDGSHSSGSDSPTFDEIWRAVFQCSIKAEEECSYIGVEAWMVFCRFIALAQYLEAKRRFSARHRQQTMRHRNAPRGSELVMVDLPPLEPPVPLSVKNLVEHNSGTMPELDLDHSLLAAHDKQGDGDGSVKITVFGNKGLILPSELEFAVSFSRGGTEVVVRRAMDDMQWLDETFRSHKVLGGTLCGRILPPFPVMNNQSSVELESTKTIHAAAAASVGRIKSAAQWVVSGIRTHQRTEPKRGPVVNLPESYATPEGKAHQLERYLNYLLEHPALSTSFPLNAILTASQSGLDAAKLCVAECNTKATEIADPQHAEADESRSLYNFEWVRTAAQAAMALKVHGMLETSGLQSASAKLQHAALPHFGPSARRSDWDDRSWDDGNNFVASQELESSNFEDGVVDDDGYDLLPLPVPAPERRILTVGNGNVPSSEEVSSSLHVEERFHYGMGALDSREERLANEDGGAYLADIAVDQNIDKLREVIGSVDNTLNRCLHSVARIGKAHKQRLQLHQDVVRKLDSWPEMRGRFVSQRSLMKGVSGIDQSLEVYEESDAAFVDDLSWQAKLAGCAVTAAEDVRAAVRAARTASNARAAASAAALTAEMACEKNKFAHFDEMRALQTRASIAQSHAIHAAVVEHETKTVKRRSTMALAHDVKTWNIHRKRETLECCISFAKAQHEATRRSVDAWSSLLNGFVGTTVNPSIVERRNQQVELEPSFHRGVEAGEVTATLYDEPALFSIENDTFAPPPSPPTTNEDTSPSQSKHEESSLSQSKQGQSPLSESKQEESFLSQKQGESSLSQSKQGSSVSENAPQDDEFSFPFAEAALVSNVANFFVSNSTGSQVSQSTDPDHEEPPKSSTNASSKKLEERLSDSMQSLVDGLMSWGGGFDVEEDLALPAGVAASIAMEGNLGIS